ncbi:MAG TPA: IclR family transcriptional regulator [Burkholderiales bacterium]|nr:IclR family transcriptional regulator [Burkholderiales bacterium]
MQSKLEERPKSMVDDRSEDNNGATEFVRALAKGLAVIEAFDAQTPMMTLSDVAKRTGLSRGTSRRLLHTLVELGYVAFDGKYFSLKPRVLNLGFAYLYSHDVWQVAQPYMVEVVEKLHESCSIAVLDGKDIVYVARVPTSQRIMSINLGLGTRLPAHATSMGRVLLAGQPESELRKMLDNIGPLPQYTPKSIVSRAELLRELQQVKKQGWALVDQELELGLRSLAVPIVDAQGAVAGALNIGTQASRWTVAALTKDALPVLRAAAQRISALLAPGRGRS